MSFLGIHVGGAHGRSEGDPFSIFGVREDLFPIGCERHSSRDLLPHRNGSIQTYDQPHIPREPDHRERRRPLVSGDPLPVARLSSHVFNEWPVRTDQRRCAGPLHTPPARSFKRLYILREVCRHEDNRIFSKGFLWGRLQAKGAVRQQSRLEDRSVLQRS